MKLLIMLSSPASCHFLSLSPNTYWKIKAKITDVAHTYQKGKKYDGRNHFLIHGIL
jgi:hypothetical protein